MISAIVPPSCSPGDRCVILGVNFIDTKSLSVKLGEILVKPEFHENVTLIVNIPSNSPFQQVEVLVSNDGIEYCSNNIFLLIQPP